MKREILALSWAVLFWALMDQAWAESILVAHGFDGTNGAVIGLAPGFNPDLGTLDSVNVTLQGRITAEGFAVPFATPVGPGGSLVTTPFPFELSIRQDFDGLAGTYFDFDSDAIFTLPGRSLGGGDRFNIGTNFSYGFTFSAATDDAGGLTFPSSSTSFGTLIPPTSVSGLRADFVRSIFGVDEVDMVLSGFALPRTFGGTAVFIDRLSTEGAAFIQYNFTPRAAVAVEEPASLVLFGIALAGLCFSRRKRPTK